MPELFAGAPGCTLTSKAGRVRSRQITAPPDGGEEDQEAGQSPEWRLCAPCKSVILGANRTGLLTFVSEPWRKDSKGFFPRFDLVLARIAGSEAVGHRSARLRSQPIDALSFRWSGVGRGASNACAGGVYGSRGFK